CRLNETYHSRSWFRIAPALEIVRSGKIVSAELSSLIKFFAEGNGNLHFAERFREAFAVEEVVNRVRTVNHQRAYLSAFHLCNKINEVFIDTCAIVNGP